MNTEEQGKATYYTAEVGHERQGPWTREQMIAMIQEGRFSPASVWWCPGMAQWQRICTFPMPSQSYNLLNATTAGLRRAVRFTGRSCRAEFWFFLLAVFLFFIALGIINCIGFSYNYQDSVFMGTLILMAYCGVALLAAAARRLHDAGLTSLLLLFLLIPLLGPFGLAPFLLFPSQSTGDPHATRPLAPWE